MSKHISVFYNLTSGKANFTKQLSKIENILIELNYTYDFYNYLELKDKIKDVFTILKKESKRRILICGGDGTYHYFINDLMKYNVNDFFELSLFPLGTSNDLASFYKFSKKLKK